MAQANVQDSAELEVHRQGFSGFVSAGVWVCGHIAQAVALLTLAFAIGAGWWAGLTAYVAIGVVVGLLFRMSSAWWAAQIAQWVLLGIGGMIVPALAGLMR